MTDRKLKDLVWYTAVEWVIREHGLLSSVDKKNLIIWLNRNPAHKAAYNEASSLWLLSGMAFSRIPPIRKPKEN